MFSKPLYSVFWQMIFFQQIDDYSLVTFLPLDPNDEDSINNALIQIDNAIQYGEDLEPREYRVNF